MCFSGAGESWGVEGASQNASDRDQWYIGGCESSFGRQLLTFEARLSMAVLIGILLETASSWAAVQDTVPAMTAPPRDASEYYPPASLRSGETGLVVVGFTLNADGKAVEPFTLDGTSGSSSYRLIVAAERYLRDARFGNGWHSTKRLVVSFVFEIAPCGLLAHRAGADYTVDLCRDPSPPSQIRQP